MASSAFQISPSLSNDSMSYVDAARVLHRVRSHLARTTANSSPEKRDRARRACRQLDALEAVLHRYCIMFQVYCILTRFIQHCLIKLIL